MEEVNKIKSELEKEKEKLTVENLFLREKLKELESQIKFLSSERYVQMIYDDVAKKLVPQVLSDFLETFKGVLPNNVLDEMRKAVTKEFKKMS